MYMCRACRRNWGGMCTVTETQTKRKNHQWMKEEADLGAKLQNIVIIFIKEEGHERHLRPHHLLYWVTHPHSPLMKRSGGPPNTLVPTTSHLPYLGQPLSAHKKEGEGHNKGTTNHFVAVHVISNRWLPKEQLLFSPRTGPCGCRLAPQPDQ